MNDFLLKSH